MHKIEYLPIAKKDLTDIIFYIADKLKAPKAAADLADELDNAIKRLADFPFSCRVYNSPQPLDDEHRLLMVKKYSVFYVVSEDTVEIRRIIYAKRDLTKIIK